MSIHGAITSHQRGDPPLSLRNRKRTNQAAGNQCRSSTEWVIIQQYQIINTESNGKSNFKELSPRIIRNFLRGVENTQRLLSNKFIPQDWFPKNIASALLYSASALLCRCKGSKYDLTWIPLGWSNSKHFMECSKCQMRQWLFYRPVFHLYYSLIS